MKVNPTIAIFLILTFSCAQKRNTNLSYVKIFTIGSADTITMYNKGIGVDSYLYYNSKDDSLIYIKTTDIELQNNVEGKYEYQTFSGYLENNLYNDTIGNLINVLKKYKSGIIIQDSTQEGYYSYCGPHFYVEFADDEGVHYNMFTLSGNETLNQFNNFFGRLPTLPWNKLLVGNADLNVDSQMIAVLTKLGEWEKVNTPYFPLPCNQEIDFDKIYGRWRIVRDRRDWNFTRVTIDKKGTYFWETLIDGKVTQQSSIRFLLHPADSTFILRFKENIDRCTILRLTENCFEFKSENDNTVLRLDRLQ